MIEIIEDNTLSELEDIIARLQNICGSFEIIVAESSAPAIRLINKANKHLCEAREIIENKEKF